MCILTLQFIMKSVSYQANHQLNEAPKILNTFFSNRI